MLTHKLPAGEADVVISTFGLKTFNDQQLELLAQKIAGTLRAGGVFSVIEAADPKGWRLRPFYRFYLDAILPWVERLFLRGAQDFSMIGVYTQAFGDARSFEIALRRAGLEAEATPYFLVAPGGWRDVSPQHEPKDTTR